MKSGSRSASTLSDVQAALQGRAVLERVDFADLDGFDGDDLSSAAHCWLRSASFERTGTRNLRPGVRTPSDLGGLFAQAQKAPPTDAFSFFSSAFCPYRVRLTGEAASGLLTGYYEPRVAGSRRRTAEFTEPLLSRPPDLVTFSPGEDRLGSGLEAARRCVDGRLVPYPTRAEIESGEVSAEPLVWVRDGIEAFMIHVQGSARLTLEDGADLRVTYAGRNGRPYTSIGRLLIDRGDVPLADMSLARLKDWVRAAGQQPCQAGRRLMQENQSFIFFDARSNEDPASGPIGGEGVALTALRSLAVDRAIWPYGLPFWIEATLPWRSNRSEPFRHLLIAQDTGSAIVGPARADLFFGTGTQAGDLAGSIRHAAEFYVLLPGTGS